MRMESRTSLNNLNLPTSLSGEALWLVTILNLKLYLFVTTFKLYQMSPKSLPLSGEETKERVKAAKDQKNSNLPLFSREASGKVLKRETFGRSQKIIRAV